tara:strand:+ start:203 stop:724 length:522 start_codon:yes stop_codon:yes gene_type:complete
MKNLLITFLLSLGFLVNAEVPGGVSITFNTAGHLANTLERCSALYMGIWGAIEKNPDHPMAKDKKDYLEGSKLMKFRSSAIYQSLGKDLGSWNKYDIEEGILLSRYYSKIFGDFFDATEDEVVKMSQQVVTAELATCQWALLQTIEYKFGLERLITKDELLESDIYYAPNEKK